MCFRKFHLRDISRFRRQTIEIDDRKTRAWFFLMHFPFYTDWRNDGQTTDGRSSCRTTHYYWSSMRFTFDCDVDAIAERGTFVPFFKFSFRVFPVEFIVSAIAALHSSSLDTEIYIFISPFYRIVLPFQDAHIYINIYENIGRNAIKMVFDCLRFFCYF